MQKIQFPQEILIIHFNYKLLWINEYDYKHFWILVKIFTLNVSGPIVRIFMMTLPWIPQSIFGLSGLFFFLFLGIYLSIYGIQMGREIPCLTCYWFQKSQHYVLILQKLLHFQLCPFHTNSYFFWPQFAVLGLVLKITPRPRHFETISPSLCIFEKSGLGPGKTD